MTQLDVATALNMTQSGYSLLELGKRKADAHQILQLCEIFNCTPNDLFGIKGVHEIISAEIR